MTTNLEKFTRNLDRLLERRSGTGKDPALQAAAILLSLNIDAEAAPPADLRARWLARTKRVTTVERTSFMMLMRNRPFVALLLVLVTLLALSSVVYALGRVFGYIPGVGLVDQSMPLRVLAEPVSQTRDGVTLTVEEALLSVDKTVVRFHVENIPPDKLADDGSECSLAAGLKLPDGTLLQNVGGFAVDVWDTGYEKRSTFAPVPVNTNEAIWVLPCIQNARLGTLPENWELTLRFRPAPADLTVAAVVEVPPSQDASVASALVLEKVIETDTGYILAGKFRSMGFPQGAKAVQFSSWPKIVDASGQEVPFTLANLELDLPFEATEPGVFPWAFELEGKSFPWPLTIKVETVVVEYPNAEAQFEFDTGPNPQDEQVWPLDIDLELAGYPVRVRHAIRTTDGYMFNFESQSPAVFHGVDLTIGASSQALSGMDSPANFSSTVSFVGEIPAGRLTVLLTRPRVALPGEWTLEWKPEDSPGMVTQTSQGTPPACLTADSWQAAFANPQPIPAELNRRVIVTGPLDENATYSAKNIGTFFVNLDGSDKHILGQTTWASPSPDGSQVVYAWDDGLYIEDVVTGGSRLIPNTIPNDHYPLWSPSGTRIAFFRMDDQNLYVIHPDGTGLQQLTQGAEQESLLDWLPDGSSLVYAVERQDGMVLRHLEPASGAVTDLFQADTGSQAAISPDGKRIVFFDDLDPMNIGMYISALDGSDRKLIAQIRRNARIGQVSAIAPKWSSDGNWLAVNIGTANPDWPGTALVNVTTCQIVPLPIVGMFDAWLR